MFAPLVIKDFYSPILLQIGIVSQVATQAAHDVMVEDTRFSSEETATLPEMDNMPFVKSRFGFYETYDALFYSVDTKWKQALVDENPSLVDGFHPALRSKLCAAEYQKTQRAWVRLCWLAKEFLWYLQSVVMLRELVPSFGDAFFFSKSQDLEHNLTKYAKQLDINIHESTERARELMHVADTQLSGVVAQAPTKLFGADLKRRHSFSWKILRGAFLPRVQAQGVIEKVALAAVMSYRTLPDLTSAERQRYYCQLAARRIADLRRSRGSCNRVISFFQRYRNKDVNATLMSCPEKVGIVRNDLENCSEQQ